MLTNVLKMDGEAIIHFLNSGTDSKQEPDQRQDLSDEDEIQS